nr:S-adenosylmethionine:tRNA ribosyltransferase-isomerase [Ignavibacteriota bacterium]
MKLSEFRYIAPKSNIAKFPADPRDSAKMMVLNKATGEMEDKTFRDIMDYFQKGDCIVVNE